MKDLEMTGDGENWHPCLCENAEEVLKEIRHGGQHRLKKACETCGRPFP